MQIRLHSLPLFVFQTMVLFWVVPVTTQAEDAPHVPVIERVGQVLKSDIYRLSLGGSVITLRNPNGFDVSSSTYDNGRPESDFLFGGGQFFWSLTGEKSVGWKGRRKRLWYARFDSEDFAGLKLQNLLFGAGYAVDPAKAFALGARFAGGVGTGMTRSSSYFDSALHLSLEAWVSVGIQLGRLTWDISLRERKSLGATLDARSAAPRTRITTVALGWLF